MGNSAEMDGCREVEQVAIMWKDRSQMVEAAAARFIRETKHCEENMESCERHAIEKCWTVEQRHMEEDAEMRQKNRRMEQKSQLLAAECLQWNRSEEDSMSAQWSDLQSEQATITDGIQELEKFCDETEQRTALARRANAALRNALQSEGWKCQEQQVSLEVE